VAGPKIDVRVAKSSELDQAAACLVAAFLTDPITRFAWPEPYDHLRHMTAGIRGVVSDSIESGGCCITPDHCGCALWLPPGLHVDGEAFERTFRASVDPEQLGDLLGTFEKMFESHPDEPHWYLPMIGVDPNAQGRGLGGALMRFAVERCDREGALAYLESSNPRNITLYERHGFERMGEIKVGAAPLVTPMLRQPR
jgi:ribosomal protein S18 acetylase RimI-like enzyme